MASVNSLCFCGSGKKKKKCHRDVSDNSLLAEIYCVRNNFDEVVSKQKGRINCPVNCSECCSDYFPISENEFFVILDSLQRKGGNALVRKYISKSNEVYREMKERYPEFVSQLDSYNSRMTTYDLLGDLDSNIQAGSGLPCIFLENGRCSIYQDRPNVCRFYGMCNKCSIINNLPYRLPEQNTLTKLNELNLKNGKVLVKRMYPIFYWFYYFLNSENYSFTIGKLNIFRSQSAKQYIEFTTKYL